MSAVRSLLRNRIALLLVMVCMIMGFVVPSVWTDYSDLAALNNNALEIHILDLRGMRDCILAAPAGSKSSGAFCAVSSRKSTNGFIRTASIIALPDPVFSSHSLWNCMSYVPAPPGMRTISSFLIISIHLKDGNK